MHQMWTNSIWPESDFAGFANVKSSSADDKNGLDNAGAGLRCKHISSYNIKTNSLNFIRRPINNYQDCHFIRIVISSILLRYHSSWGLAPCPLINNAHGQSSTSIPSPSFLPITERVWGRFELSAGYGAQP